MNRLLLAFFVVLIPVSMLAQSSSKKKEKKGTVYFAFGSHRTYYTNSDITLERRGDPKFDFTLYDVKAKDEGGLRFKTAPQFSYHAGYYFKKKNFGLEYHYDHIKYFVQANQVVRMKGSIGGKIYDTDTLTSPGFVQLEHSDGGNYAMINIVKWFPLIETTDRNFRIDLTTSAGLGLVNPKTNSTILGNHRDDRYHISGYVIGAETGVKLSFLRHFYLSGTMKGAFANYRQFLIANGYGHQRWFSGQFIYLLGGQFDL